MKLSSNLKKNIFKKVKKVYKIRRRKINFIFKAKIYHTKIYQYFKHHNLTITTLLYHRNQFLT